MLGVADKGGFIHKDILHELPEERRENIKLGKNKGCPLTGFIV
jgi:hypothetical protein